MIPEFKKTLIIYLQLEYKNLMILTYTNPKLNSRLCKQSTRIGYSWAPIDFSFHFFLTVFIPGSCFSYMPLAFLVRSRLVLELEMFKKNYHQNDGLSHAHPTSPATSAYKNNQNNLHEVIHNKGGVGLKTWGTCVCFSYISRAKSV
ncbi:hypothetical protein CLIB1423_10S01178 [[Candida] railenensis]|uniref:Uncharacterized protein n=1 Tax=[Candida] railenensis TaxID=45579 RepID=A0A9P0VYT8_9ASCO|nr:hypothetical protein CLIB1423_10S01178 [[Candida] railenensis]